MIITFAQAGSIILLVGFISTISSELVERLSDETRRALMDYGITLFLLGAAACALGSWLPGSWR